MDRQRNDYLGWRNWQRGLFKHGRKILRAICSNTNADPDSNGITDAHTNAYANSHCDTESNSNADAYGYTYANGHTYANTYTYTYTNTHIDAYTYSQTGHAWKHFDSVTSRNQ